MACIRRILAWSLASATPTPLAGNPAPTAWRAGLPSAVFAVLPSQCCLGLSLHAVGVVPLPPPPLRRPGRRLPWGGAFALCEFLRVRSRLGRASRRGSGWGGLSSGRDRLAVHAPARGAGSRLRREFVGRAGLYANGHRATRHTGVKKVSSSCCQLFPGPAPPERCVAGTGGSLGSRGFRTVLARWDLCRFLSLPAAAGCTYASCVRSRRP